MKKKTIKLYITREDTQKKQTTVNICPRRKYAKNDCERWMCVHVRHR